MTDPVELMAEAAFTAEHPNSMPFEQQGDRLRERFLSYQRAALSALDAAGFAVVPKEDLQAWLDRPAHGWVEARERIAAQVKQP